MSMLLSDFDVTLIKCCLLFHFVGLVWFLFQVVAGMKNHAGSNINIRKDKPPDNHIYTRNPIPYILCIKAIIAVCKDYSMLLPPVMD